jgi:hypothetical protein
MDRARDGLVDDHVVTLSGGSERLHLNFKNDNELLGKWVRTDQSGTLSGVRRKSDLASGKLCGQDAGSGVPCCWAWGRHGLAGCAAHPIP